ncbi:Uncharacterized conserved protein YjdB, contains Ig-like domain [Lachnospiraceae bacterium RM5]|nr:Uncharacterized conserved protein YjdB, contains Ig-like domain [Lachnospiraceae bacterium RM5]
MNLKIKKKTRLFSLLLTFTILTGIFSGLSFKMQNVYAIGSNQMNDATELTLGEKQKISIDADEYKYFCFIPSVNATYNFTSFGNLDTYVYLYDSEGKGLEDNDDDGNGNNFCISYSLETGKKYYFRVELYDSGENGQFDVILTIDNNLSATYKGYDSQDDFSYFYNSSCILSSPYNGQKKLEVVATADEMDGIKYEWYKSDYYSNLRGYNGYSYESIAGIEINYTKIDKKTATITTDNITKDTSYKCIVIDKYGNEATVCFDICIESNLSAWTDNEIIGNYSNIYFKEVYADSEGNCTLTAESSGDDITYEWYFDTSGYGEWSVLKKAKSKTLTIRDACDGESYACIVKDKYNNYFVIYYYITTTYNMNNFNAWPEGEENTDNEKIINIKPDTSATFEVSISGDDTSKVTYEWYDCSNDIEDEKIDGASSNKYTIDKISSSKYYYCKVFDGYDTTKYVFFYVILDSGYDAWADGYSTKDNVKIYANTNDKVTLKAASNDENASYSWYTDESDKLGSSDKCIVTAGDGVKKYRCYVSFSDGNSKVIYYYVINKKYECVSVAYKTQIQSSSWEKSYVKNGQTSGTIGKRKRLEAIQIMLTDKNGKKLDSSLGSINYRTHIQSKGWEKSYIKDGDISGTVGKGLRLEAIQIVLDGEISSYYDVNYRVHTEKFGWLEWAQNGQRAGTAGYGYRLEAIQIKLAEKKDEFFSDYTSYGYPIKEFKLIDNKLVSSYYDKNSIPNVIYKVQVQSIGWEKNYVSSGETSGTVGKSKRLEAIKICFDNKFDFKSYFYGNYAKGLNYRTHIQKYGWQKFVTDNELSGTVGKSLRLEAIQIKLRGPAADIFDVYYRVQAEKFGWLGWAKNGQSAGTAGYGYRLEAIQIQLVYKDTPAPGTITGTFKSK